MTFSPSPIDDKKKAFTFKLGAAKFHLRQLEIIFKKHRDKFELWVKEQKKTPDEIMPFFYHYDAFLYELTSCFDMILQILNLKYSLNLQNHEIGWNKEYKELLRSASKKTYEIIDYAYNEWWFKDLRTSRNFITHHDKPILGVEYTDKGINLLWFVAPRLHQTREVFDQCNIWGKNISLLYKSAVEN